MKTFVILARCALIIFCLPRRCDGCLDVLLRSFFQVFNPSVEAGPDRLISRHPYADGIMPDYPATAAGPAGDGDGGGLVGGRRIGRLAAAGADHKDGPTVPRGRRRWARGGPKDATGSSATEGRPRAGALSLRGGGGGGGDYSLGSLTDFIASLIETVQLTSRATLKRSRANATTTAASTNAAALTTALRRPRAAAPLVRADFEHPSGPQDVL